MVTKTRTLKTIRIGDVVMSDLFAFGEFDSKLKPPAQVGLSEPRLTWVSQSENPPKKTGRKEGHNVETLMYDASDETRRKAKFVVIELRNVSGGSFGHHPNDLHPGGTAVVIQRLHPDGSFHEKGETLFFYMGDNYLNAIERVQLVGRMKRIFVPA
jgi:hypothetical protein